ncbi:unnamed protein product [Gongylonema pulchrum]|uniref:DNA topoisomerase (ATP-hydrolyzing) n=1 Tax=Gongylonema pulchrum TaxID=637853 RepID=A0A183EU49_9BILA|nr:unnamed protein product [Gongylonema pulchrum]
MIFGTLFTSSNYDDSELKCWRDNMNEVDEPVIEDASGSETIDYTCVTFKPDLSKFKLTSLDSNTVDVMVRRVVDVAGTLDGVNVFLNGTKVEVSGFEDYVKLFAPNSSENGDDSDSPCYVTVNDRWQIAVARSDVGFQQISFVNNINTLKVFLPFFLETHSSFF